MSIPRATLLVVVMFINIGVLSGASKKPVRASRGMVVSADSMASAIGVAVLKKGGNAIDAAVAVGFTLAVTYPEAGNIGGGGFMLVRLADGRTTMIDFREQAPFAAHRDMYLDSAGEVRSGASENGSLSAGVPGTVAGLLLALERYGSFDREEVLEPSIMLAERGFRVDRQLAESLGEFSVDFNKYSSSQTAFTRNGILRQGDILKQEDLARTLKAISDEGEKGFYEGKVAELIVAEMDRGGGIISRQDLASYSAVERVPLRGLYRGYEILTSPPPSAGGVVVLQTLNMLEQFDLRRMEIGSSRSLHVFAAATQRSYADRAVYLGDPDFVEMPLAELLSKEYATERARTVDSLQATPSTRIHAGQLEETEGQQTTHYCVVDGFGNVVSATVTLNGFYGSKTVVGGAGFFLNNEMDDFVVKPGTPNMYGLVGGEANAIAPRKRMLSSMAPTIVLKDGKPFMAVGGRGGSRISTAVAQVIMNVIDYDLNMQEAIDWPRIHHQWLPDRIFYEPHGLPPDVRNNLTRMGYSLELTFDHNGRCQALMIDPLNGEFLGAPDPREEGVAIGY
ncbi:MAG: gamma-glutamyltransferase [Bacteroidota bacterium]